MIKNRKLKIFLINCVFPIFSLVNKIVPKDDKSILIYCANDELNDNSEVLYNYLIVNRYFEKYKIFCSLKNYRNYTSLSKKRVKFISSLSGLWRYMRSGYVFYSMGKLPIKPTKKQMVINMWHGIPLKRIGKLANFNNGEEFFFTFVCAPSEFYKPIMAKAFGCPEENVCICDELKIDRMYNVRKHENKIKLVLWAPTFRQSNYLGYSDSKLSSFLPLINDTDWAELNKFAENINIKIIVKLHAVQTLNGFTEKLYSNLEIYSDYSFRKHGYNLYEFMAQADALLADYSSVYLEYLLLNRPIGFTLNDIDDYKETRGFVFENPLDYMPGEKLYCKSDLLHFLEDIAEEKDIYSNERQRVCNIVHQYKDGKNCERLLKIAGIEK